MALYRVTDKENLNFFELVHAESAMGAKVKAAVRNNYRYEEIKTLVTDRRGLGKLEPKLSEHSRKWRDKMYRASLKGNR